MTRRPAAADWTLVAEIMRAGTYADRVDLILATISGVTAYPDTYLYLPDASGRRLRLERTRATHLTENSSAAASTMTPEQEGGAGWSAPTPPLELLRTAEDQTDRVVSTPVGRMYAVAFHAADGSLSAVIQAGPLGDGPPSSGLGAHIDTVRAAMAFVLEQTRAQEATRQQLAEATARLQSAQRLAGSALDLDRFTRLLLDLALTSTGTQAGFVAIQRSNGAGLEVRAQTGMPDRFAQDVDLSPDGGLFDWSVAAEGGALMLADIDAATALGIRALLAVPLIEAEDPLGIFALVNFDAGADFDDNCLDLCEAFAEQIRLMLHNARIFSVFADRYLETVMGLARVLDARSALTHGHHERVASTASALAVELRFPPPECALIRTAGLIHDVGLVGAGDVEGASESDIEHPVIGASMVEHLPVPTQLPDAVATHHEWYDGWGFPAGLSGEQIPLSGRVLALAEFVVEMSSQTPVRDAWSVEKLAREITQRRGTQFDPAVADAGIALLRTGAIQVPSLSGR